MVQSLPLLMENLIEPELKEIRDLAANNQVVAACFPDGIHDPCPKYCGVMEDFVSWYFKTRRTVQTESSIFDVAQLGLRLSQRMKEIFPDRAGTTYLCFV